MERLKGISRWIVQTVRGLRRDRTITLTSIVCVALSIGTSTSVFVLVYAILFHPYPYVEPQSLVRVYSKHPSERWDTWPVSLPDFLDWRAENEVFDGLTFYRWNRVVVRTDRVAESVRVAEVEETFLSLLGIAPTMGHGFDVAGLDNSNVVVLTSALSMVLSGFDENGAVNLIGSEVLLDDEPYTIVGILPNDAIFPDPVLQPGMLVPFTAPSSDASRNERNLNVVARLRSGVTRDEAEHNVEMISRRLAETYPNSNRGWGSKVVFLREAELNFIRPQLAFIALAAFLVAGIGILNAVSLNLVRVTARLHEFGLRLALGGRRSGIALSLVGESLLLSMVGGAIGTMLSSWVLVVTRSLVPEYLLVLSRWMYVEASAVVFSVAVVFAAGLVIGFVPAGLLWRAAVGRASSDSTLRTTASISHRKLRRTLVVGQLATSTTLLVMSGLVYQSLMKLKDVDLGFDPSNLLTMKIAHSRSTSSAEDSRAVPFFQKVLSEVREIPSVKATLASHVPFAWDGAARYATGEDLQERDSPAVVTYVAVEAEFHSVLRIPLLRGRYFSESDDARARRVALINDRAARIFFTGTDPIGKQLTLSSIRQEGRASNSTMFEIVGVVAYARHGPIREDDVPLVYVPFQQAPEAAMYLAVRSLGDDADLTRVIMKRIETVGPDHVVYNVRLMRDLISRQMAVPVFNASILNAYGVVAIILVICGVFAHLGYSVTVRARELAIRATFGATPHDLGSIILAEGMALGFAGCGAGLLIAWHLRSLVSSQLFGIDASDLRTFATVGSLVLVASALAALLPALRAARSDPLERLRAN